MTKAFVGRQIVEKQFGLKMSGYKKGAIRITPTNNDVNLTSDDYINILTKCGLNVKCVIPPGNFNSKSSKFYTYEVENCNNKIYYIVFGLGVNGNEGMKYERKIINDIQTSFKLGIDHDLLTSLKQNICDLQIENVVEGYHRKVDRPLDLIPYEVGSVIADIIFKQPNGNFVYGSIKNITGAIISNHGLSDCFEVSNDIISYKGTPLIDLILEELKVDKTKMVNGLNDYSLKNLSTFERIDNVTLNHPENLKNLICSAFGYGYYIIKECINNNYDIIDITTINKLNDYVGGVQQATLVYPYYKNETKRCKTMAIKVQTTNHKFEFSIRNNTGGIVPNIINLTKL
jgi:hypothetical protein